jgi:hypothetical protein
MSQKRDSATPPTNTVPGLNHDLDQMPATALIAQQTEFYVRSNKPVANQIDRTAWKITLFLSHAA